MKSHRRKDPAQEADEFNARHPVGTPVRYWMGRREGEGVLSETRAPAQVMCDHASVWVKGRAGSIALSHVEVVEAEHGANPVREEVDPASDGTRTAVGTAEPRASCAEGPAGGTATP